MASKRKASTPVTPPQQDEHRAPSAKRAKASHERGQQHAEEEPRPLCYLHRDCATMSLVMHGLHVLGLPKKTHVFRGTSPGEPMMFAPAVHRPTYFGNVSTAREYGHGQDGQCVAYKTSRDLCLLDMSDEFNIRELHKRLAGEDRQALEILTGYGRTRLTPEEAPMLDPSCYYERKAPFEIRICTAGFLTEHHQQHKEYISKQVAQIVCKLNGIDGWVFGNTYRRGNGAPFHAEVMLCNPAGAIDMVPQSCEAFEFETLVEIRRRFGLRSIEELVQLFHLFNKLSRWNTPQYDFEKLLAAR